MSLTAIHAYVTGRVQAVGFRQTCRSIARAQHLVGWVRNLPDGRVEVWAQGPAEAVERLLGWLWMGPPGARVSGVESHDVAIDPALQDFLVTR
jgi:acylphosphatase